MKRQFKKQLSTGKVSFQNQLQHWQSFAKNKYDELNLIREKVAAKCTKNLLEEQMKNDVILNLDKMMTVVQMDLLRPLSRLDRELKMQHRNKEYNEEMNLASSYEHLAQCVRKINASVTELKKRSKHFLKRQEFGKRHGYYRYFNGETMPSQSL